MNIGKSRKTSDLAALDGATFGLDKAMTLVSFVLLFVIVFIPIFMIVYNAFFFEGRFDIEMFQNVVFSKDNVDAMTNTVIIGVAVTFFGTVVGLFYAWLLGRSDIPCKGLMRALIMIPYMFPPFFGAKAWDMGKTVADNMSKEARGSSYVQDDFFGGFSAAEPTEE